MKWNPFKRTQDTTGQAPAMPPELTDYYNAEHRQRSVVTWLLGIATLAVTVALAFALFLGARWVINKVNHRGDQSPQPTTVQTTAPAAPAPPAPTSSTTNTPATTTQTGQTQTATTQQSSSTPKTSSATTNLPNTGPGDVLAIMLGATVLGTLVHRRYARR